MLGWRRELLTLVCCAALAATAAACGSPAKQSRTFSEDVVIGTPTEATPLAAETVTPAPDKTAADIPAHSTPTVEIEPSATFESTSTPEVAPTPDIEASATVPPPCRSVTFGPRETLTAADLVARGSGVPVRKPFLGVNLVIERIRVNAHFVVRTVGADGQMPRVGNATDVAWYDFSQWPELGGTPGTDHGNVVIAGDYDDINVPQAVFYRLSELARGDIIQLNTSDGRTLAYTVEFNKITAVDAIDWTELVRATPEESITLITAAAARNQGRRIVWGRAFDTACSR